MRTHFIRKCAHLCQVLGNQVSPVLIRATIIAVKTNLLKRVMSMKRALNKTMIAAITTNRALKTIPIQHHVATRKTICRITSLRKMRVGTSKKFLKLVLQKRLKTTLLHFVLMQLFHLNLSEKLNFMYVFSFSLFLFSFFFFSFSFSFLHFLALISLFLKTIFISKVLVNHIPSKFIAIKFQ